MSKYIKKQDVLDLIESAFRWSFPLATIYEKIQSMPTADVRPMVRGEWIKCGNNPLDGNYYCSNCHKGVDIADGIITPIGIDLYFCPNCGRDMRDD